MNQQAFSSKMQELWDFKTFRYSLLNNRFSFTHIFEKSEEICGFVNYQKVKYIAGKDKNDVVWIKQLLFNNCTIQEQTEFLKIFISYFREMNIDSISIPDTGAWDTILLENSGFIKMDFKNMQISLYMVIFNDENIELKADNSFCLEIL